MKTKISLRVDGIEHTVAVDPRWSVLDLLREWLGVTSVKKGCDHGQCGACTVLLNGRRVLSCLALAIAHQGAEITTAAGLASSDTPHPLREAFLEHDAYQCGYCTPGQICAAAGVLDEIQRGWPSAVARDITTGPTLDEREIAERMSGNLCRCGAYPNIVRAVLATAQREASRESTPVSAGADR